MAPILTDGSVVWKPAGSRWSWVGIGIVLAIVATDVGLIALIRGQGISGWTFVIVLLVLISLPILARLLYWIYGCRNLCYMLDRDALTIVWAGTQEVIPLADIKRVLHGHEMTGRSKTLRGPYWPGHWTVESSEDAGGKVHFYTTQPPPHQLVLVTRYGTYALSPEDMDGMLSDLEAHLALGPNPTVTHQVRQWRILTLPLWRDRVALGLLILALVCNLSLFGYISVRYPGLPQLLPLHFDALGEPDRIGPRTELFWLPTIGLLVLSINTLLGFMLHRHERLATYLLLAVACLVQGILAVAIFNIIH